MLSAPEYHLYSTAVYQSRYSDEKQSKKRPRNTPNPSSAKLTTGCLSVGDLSSLWDEPVLNQMKIAFHELNKFNNNKYNETSLRTKQESLKVFVCDIDDAVVSLTTANQMKIPSDLTPSNQDEISFFRLFGRDRQGRSVCLNIWGFYQYLYCEYPRNGYDLKTGRVDNEISKLLENNLTEFLSKQPGSAGGCGSVLVETVMGESLMHYNFEERLKPFLKITVTHSKKLSIIRSYIQDNSVELKSSSGVSYNIPSDLYEANVPPVLRLMVDTGIAGCCFIEVNSSDLNHVDNSLKHSVCDIEASVDYKKIISHPPEGEWQDIPNDLRILSLDIECVTVTGKGFPVAERDPVIQIGCVVSSPGDPCPSCKCVFTLDTCSFIPGSSVFSFVDERTMLIAFREFVVSVDPDILTGYNFVSFDLRYLIRRSEILDVRELRLLGRLARSEARVKKGQLTTRALGTHEQFDINTEGRLQFDILEIVRREFKLKSYTLNAVSAHFLQEQKEDVHYFQMADLQRGSPETRCRIAVYCIKDALLPIRLLQKCMLLVNYIEMARVTGVPMSYLLYRGQQIKVTSQILRCCKRRNFFMPTLRQEQKPQAQGEGAAYEGATVLDPDVGFYKTEPIATLDFASLYPSIMIAHNLCYSTYVPREKLNYVNRNDVVQTPLGTTFVRSTKKKGLLPEVVEDLLAARKKAKKEMKFAKDEFTKQVLNGRQLALKLSANSVYGYTGVTTGGQLPLLEISAAITSYGRQMIDSTKKAVESRKWKRDDGSEVSAKVIYGDTDSVMVEFRGVTTVQEAMRMGLKAATVITGQFPSPIALEFEKVFSPFILMNKKRYAGLKYTSPDKPDKIDCKGIETVRRDFCDLVQKMVDETLHELLYNRDAASAVRKVQQRISDLLQNRIDMSYLVLSKSLGKEDYAMKMAHVVLASKLKKRDPVTAPQVGDRVYYVMVERGGNLPQYERAEDPLYVLEHNLTLDIPYYLDSIRNPILRIFEGTGIGADVLFAGDHTKALHKPKITSGALTSFVVKGLRCLSCFNHIKEGAFCAHCIESKKHTKVIIDKINTFQKLERDYSMLWVECQRCMGSLHQDIICSCRDCPVFYRRMKSQKDIQNLSDDMRRLHMKIEDD